jgi:hypothetical protein
MKIDLVRDFNRFGGREPRLDGGRKAANQPEAGAKRKRPRRSFSWVTGLCKRNQNWSQGGHQGLWGIGGLLVPPSPFFEFIEIGSELAGLGFVFGIVSPMANQFLFLGNEPR